MSSCSYIKERGEWGMCDVGFCVGATMNDKQCSADTIIFLDAPPGSRWNGSRDANRRKREGKKEKKEVRLG